MPAIDQGLRRELIAAQRNEITEHVIYSRLAQAVKDPENAEVLACIAEDELKHYRFWRGYTGQEVAPNRWLAFKFYWIARILGITFGIKLMERGEAQVAAAHMAETIPAAREIIEDEDRHEHELLELLDEDRLRYIGSVVLGLNDALIELTGALAGFTFALQNTRLIALTGLITGIAASLSMAASEYLATKNEEGHQKSPIKSTLYTGVSYILTVTLLVAPYLFLENYLLALGLAQVAAVMIILVFTYYISVAKDTPFLQRFTEMAAISLGVAVLSFGIGYLIRISLGVEI